MLFACGVGKDNELFTAESEEWAAYQEFHVAFNSNPLNPWYDIKKEDIFEYHLTNIFKGNPDLKAKAMKAVNFYNDCWTYYQQSFDLYDAPKEPRTKLSDKQKYLLGEDQMLAYLFSSQARFLWAASIGMEAIVAIEELDDEIGATGTTILQSLSWLPGMPSAEQICDKAQECSFIHNDQKFSFLDVWVEIKGQFLQSIIAPSKKVDFVTFSGHGCVMSFDRDLVAMQRHGNIAVAQRLGIELWDSLYEKGLKPFYQKAGTQESVIAFPKI